MKKYFATLLFTLITTFSLAQNNYQDVVYMKNGNIVRGVITEHVPNKSIKIKTANENVIVLQRNEIKKIVKEPKEDNSDNSSISNVFQKGHKGILEYIGLYNTSDMYSFRGLGLLSLNIIYGYQINPFFSLGIGAGTRLYQYNGDARIIPVFADFRANFLDNKVSPYTSLGVGYSFDISNHFEGGGLFVHPAAGVSIIIADGLALNLGLGYEMQQMIIQKYYSSEELRYDGNRSYTDSEIARSYSLIIGFSFESRKKNNPTNSLYRK